MSAKKICAQRIAFSLIILDKQGPGRGSDQAAIILWLRSNRPLIVFEGTRLFKNARFLLSLIIGNIAGPQ